MRNTNETGVAYPLKKVSDETLKQNLKRWKKRLPIKEDFSDTQYHLFFEQNWFLD